MGPQPLDAIFEPKSIAVVGATEKMGSVGRTILQNLISSPFGGTVYPVNPKRPSVLGIKAYPTITSIGEPIDLAVVVCPASTVPAVIQECADLHVKGAVIISAGFKETGPDGIALETEILRIAKSANMRIVGPNCLGVMRPPTGLNATFAGTIARKGEVGFISQSGALCTAVLDWSLRENVGFSYFISIGSMLDVEWGDLITYLGNDPETKSILIYMESIGNARSFISAAREVALTKPIIVIKAGRTEAAAKAAVSHTGTLTGSDDVLEAAFKRCGVLRVNEIEELFYSAQVIAKQPRPKGPRLTVVTNAGGPGVLVSDAHISNGGELAEISAQTTTELNEILPAHWSHGNPIDILGDADADRYAKSLEIASRDPNSDGLLVILTPQAMTDPTATAAALKNITLAEGKPVLASWMGGNDVAEGKSILTAANIPTFDYPDTAAKIYNYMWKYAFNLQGLYETPSLPSGDCADTHNRINQVRDRLQAIQASGRELLTEFESKQLLKEYQIPVVPTEIATTSAEAVSLAEKMGFPVVLKLHSESITHKTDVGGVQLNLDTPDAVTQAFDRIRSSVDAAAGPGHFDGVVVQPMIRLSNGYELIVGSSLDAQFGPVLLFGTGGQLVEIFHDRALSLPPLNTTLAVRMMEQTRIFKALHGTRGRDPVDLALLSAIMVRFSELVVEQPLIKEIDINPLFVSSDTIVALDARIVLHSANSQTPLTKPAIRPYPSEYISHFSAGDDPVIIRPIRPEDEPRMVAFHRSLSEKSVYRRYAQPVDLKERIAHERLTRMCFIDYDREIALVAQRVLPGAVASDAEIVGVVRMSKRTSAGEGVFAIVVTDHFQGKGLGSELIRQISDVAKMEGLSSLSCVILAEDDVMQAVCGKLGFVITRPDGASGDVVATISLKVAP